MYADVFIPSNLNATLSMQSSSGFQYDDNSNSKVVTFSIKDEFVKYKNNWQALK